MSRPYPTQLLNFKIFGKNLPKYCNQIAMNKHPQSSEEYNELAQEIITRIALELRKYGATMTARLLTSSILNQVPCFREGNWQYSPNGRGPCRVVTGVWNALSHQGKDDDSRGSSGNRKW